MSTQVFPQSKRRVEVSLTPQEKEFYAGLWQEADPEGEGFLTKQDALLFMGRSRLSRVTLNKIWEIADVDGKGVLGRPGFNAVLKLIANAQDGAEPSAGLLTQDAPLPRMRDDDPPATLTDESSKTVWRVFNKCGPVNGRISRRAAGDYFAQFKLPTTTIDEIWSLAGGAAGGLDLNGFSMSVYIIMIIMERGLTTVPDDLKGLHPKDFAPPAKEVPAPVALAPMSYPVPPLATAPLMTFDPTPEDSIDIAAEIDRTAALIASMQVQSNEIQKNQQAFIERLLVQKRKDNEVMLSQLNEMAKGPQRDQQQATPLSPDQMWAQGFKDAQANMGGTPDQLFAQGYKNAQDNMGGTPGELFSKAYQQSLTNMGFPQGQLGGSGFEGQPLFKPLGGNYMTPMFSGMNSAQGGPPLGTWAQMPNTLATGTSYPTFGSPSYSQPLQGFSPQYSFSGQQPLSPQYQVPQHQYQSPQQGQYLPTSSQQSYQPSQYYPAQQPLQQQPPAYQVQSVLTPKSPQIFQQPSQVYVAFENDKKQPVSTSSSLQSLQPPQNPQSPQGGFSGPPLPPRPPQKGNAVPYGQMPLSPMSNPPSLMGSPQYIPQMGGVDGGYMGASQEKRPVPAPPRAPQYREPDVVVQQSAGSRAPQYYPPPPSSGR